jgi:peptide/nickel transport system substrate-binding protein
MRRSGWQSVAVSSLLLCSVAAAETRPQYGGTLHTATRIAPATLDPADKSQAESTAQRNLTVLMFDTLVTLDAQGQPQPALATSWQAAPGNQRWQFWLRRGVKFHDGSPMTPESVAAAIRAANSTWRVIPAADSIVIERDVPDLDLPAQLARLRNAISKRSEGGAIVGTGPFHVTDWQSGKKLSLAAEEGYWNGRPFLDTIEVELGKSSRDQLIALDLGKVDVSEVAAEQSRRASTEGRRIVTSLPVELIALVFAKDKQSPEEGKLREALALSVDRASIRSVLLQGTGEPSGGILPDWISGYDFVFPSTQNLERARQLRTEAKQTQSWTLGYDPSDALLRVIAERVALNARDAGITLQATGSGPTDIRLQRLSLVSVDPRIALEAVAAATKLSAPAFRDTSVDELYRAESTLLQSERLIPLFHLPVSTALGSSVNNWSQDRDGARHLESVWLRSKP